MICICPLLLLCLMSDDRLVGVVCSVGCIFLGFLNIYTCWKQTGALLQPLSVFSLIWLIAIPVAAFDYPLMPAMSSEQWVYALSFILIFLIASAIVTRFVLGDKNFPDCPHRSFQLPPKWRCFSFFLVVISVVAVLADAVLHGGFIASSSTVYLERFRTSFSGYYLLRSLGNLGVVLLVQDPQIRKKPSFFVAVLAMLFVDLSIGVRFDLFVLGIGVISAFSNTRFSRRSVAALIIVMLGAVLAFMLIASLRDGIEQLQKYNIDTGFYHGKVDELFNTELMRYVGYAPRNTIDYVEQNLGGVMMGGYTLSPIADLLQISVTTPELIQHYGYNATDIVSYLYMDFDVLWPFFAFAWSVLINLAYYKGTSGDSIFCKYWRAVALISLTLSFYTYIHAYAYWIAYFPILISIANHFLRRWKQVA